MRRTKKMEKGQRKNIATGDRLTQIEVGEECVVVGLELAPEHSLRLRNLGCSPGVTAVCVGESPLGDPRAYGFLGGVIAIRSRDAEGILVERVQKHYSGD